MKKLLLAIAVLLTPTAARACPPSLFSGFGGCGATLGVIDIPTIQFVPQIAFQRQFFVQSQFQFPVTLPIGIGGNFGGFGGFNGFNGFGGFGGFGNNFGGFGGWFGGGNRFAQFSGRNFEFSGNFGNRFSIREGPRGGVRVRSRGGW